MPGRHHLWLPALADTESKEQQQLVSTRAPHLPCPSPEFLSELPKEAAHPAPPLSRLTAHLLLGVQLGAGSQLPAHTLGLGAGSAGHNMGQRELPQNPSFSLPLPAISFAEPKSPLLQSSPWSCRALGAAEPESALQLLGLPGVLSLLEKGV